MTCETRKKAPLNPTKKQNINKSDAAKQHKKVSLKSETWLFILNIIYRFGSLMGHIYKASPFSGSFLSACNLS